MTAGSIGVLQSTTPDRKMQTFSNSIGGVTVESEAVTICTSAGVERTSFPATGAANLITAQVTSTGTAATLVIARPTRRSVLFINTHASGTVWIGPATVTSSSGLPLGPGQSCPFSWIGLIQIIDNASTHCVVAVADEYD